MPRLSIWAEDDFTIIDDADYRRLSRYKLYLNFDYTTKERFAFYRIFTKPVPVRPKVFG